MIALAALAGCHKPQNWAYTGPRVYLIEGAANEDSDALYRIRDALVAEEINAAVFRPDNWLAIVVDIDSNPDEEAIIVGHGHGGFLATQVVRHYAQRHKMKHIDAVVTIDPFNKDWPHNDAERGEADPRTRPMPIPVGHGALKVRNYVQANPDCKRWGGELVSTRASNLAEQHPYYWYDDFWDRRPLTGQHQLFDLTSRGVTHETIDNHDELVKRIVRLTRKAALSPYHYTPPEHHPDVPRSRQPEKGTTASK